ncbi:uncharacterized protein LOC111085001 [Limulus polyphemus]|uniref:Uncharacterized protein LOC111085001 n=1 Tax=Limulus polyphemus TaxID=6850 RepID=A0ABM1S1T7_LIMPO|nr:uncharacterized protein LOC111085001 [Limulus polyphemus]
MLYFQFFTRLTLLYVLGSSVSTKNVSSITIVKVDYKSLHNHTRDVTLSTEKNTGPSMLKNGSTSKSEATLVPTQSFGVRLTTSTLSSAVISTQYSGERPEIQPVGTNDFRTQNSSVSVRRGYSVPPLPDFYSRVAISDWKIPQPSSNPYFLECSGVHHYCSFSQRASIESGFHINHYCSCDPNCIRYGDCCWDTRLKVTKQKAGEENFWACVLPINNSKSESFLMVSRCPSSWTDSEVRIQCESYDSSQLKDPFLNVPVTGEVSQVTYRNIFCAICHKDLNVLAWNVVFDCSVEFSSNVNYSSFLLKDYKNCGFFFLFPKELRKYKNSALRPCDKNIISQCSENWLLYTKDINKSKREIQNRCSLYFAPVQMSLNLNIVFKNKFCAICNSVTVDKLSCSRPQKSIIQHFDEDNIPSFAFLLDINFEQGYTLVGTKRRCLHSQVYDPWQEKCRNISCGRLFINKNGICKQGYHNLLENPVNFPDWSNSTLLSSCPKVSVSADDFKIDINGTVVLKQTGHILRFGAYEAATNTSILVCAPSKENIISKFGDIQGYLTVTCTSISLVSLFLKIIIYLFTPENHNLPAKIVVCLSISLLVGQSVFLLGTHKTHYFILCKCMAIIMHYSFLASFFWMNVLAYDICKTFCSLKVTRNVSNNRELMKYCTYGWFCPLLIVATAVTIDLVFQENVISPGYGKTLCWISNRMALLIFFAVPLGILVTVNAILFIKTTVQISRSKRHSRVAHENTGQGRSRLRLVLYVKLALVMGLTWTFGFMAAIAGSDVLWCFFIVFNSLQGAFILLAFTQITDLIALLRLKICQLFSRISHNQEKRRSIDSCTLPTQSSCAV